MKNSVLNQIHAGDCIEVMNTWPENFVDTIITDPPYGLDFMGKDWDGDVPGVHFWAEMLRVCKPGATLLSFGGTRTWHHLATAIERAGWQIRDCLMWLYGSGFPKSHNLHGEFEGYGTALKPAWEPIIVAMKPIDGTFAENAEKWGVAGINVDGGRIDTKGEMWEGNEQNKHTDYSGKVLGQFAEQYAKPSNPKGRWPANLILDEDAAGMLDGASGVSRSVNAPRNNGDFKSVAKGAETAHTTYGHGDSGGASRFFYVAKSARAERNEGCEDWPDQQTTDGCLRSNPDSARKYQANSAPRKNHHPTVKPLSLMKYLCQLTRTPTGGIVLDPFAGSGTTLWAAEFHNRPWIGIEMNPEYVAIANARIARERAQVKMAI